MIVYQATKDLKSTQCEELIQSLHHPWSMARGLGWQSWTESGIQRTWEQTERVKPLGIFIAYQVMGLVKSNVTGVASKMDIPLERLPIPG